MARTSELPPLYLSLFSSLPPSPSLSLSNSSFWPPARSSVRTSRSQNFIDSTHLSSNHSHLQLHLISSHLALGRNVISNKCRGLTLRFGRPRLRLSAFMAHGVQLETLDFKWTCAAFMILAAINGQRRDLYSVFCILCAAFYNVQPHQLESGERGMKMKRDCVNFT